jgi:hypothetical protein
MPIMSAQGQKDARGAAKLLALTARKCVWDPSAAAEGEVALNNAYRLLETFRKNAFFGLEPHAKQFPPRVTEAISLLPTSERHLKDVRIALDNAVATVFRGKSKDEAIELVETVLRQVAYPTQFGAATQSDRNHVGEFFTALIQQLTVG